MHYAIVQYRLHPSYHYLTYSTPLHALTNTVHVRIWLKFMYLCACLFLIVDHLLLRQNIDYYHDSTVHVYHEINCSTSFLMPTTLFSIGLLYVLTLTFFYTVSILLPFKVALIHVHVHVGLLGTHIDCCNCDLITS